MKSVEQWTDEELLDHVLADAKYRRGNAERTLAEKEILRRMKVSRIRNGTGEQK